MTAEIIAVYCLQKPLAVQTYPFGEIPICYKLQGKIFAELYPLENDFKITLRLPPDWNDFYRNTYPGKVVRGYHCPPVQQPYKSTVYPADFPEEVLRRMIDQAYQTVFESLPKRVQTALLKETEDPGD